MNDRGRTAIIAFIQSIIPVLTIFGVINVTDVQIAAVMLAINNGLTMMMYFWKSGQEGGVVPVTPVTNVPTEGNPNPTQP